MQVRSILLGSLLAMSVAVYAEKDAFDGWTPQQLKVKVLQLQKENKDLKDKLVGMPAVSAVASAPKTASPSTAKSDLVLDDFEADTARNGMAWWSGFDDNKLGTTLQPAPFVAAKGGSPMSPGHSGRIHGKMGANHEPWPWATLALPLASEDLRPYSAISFYAKGDGQKHNVVLCKREVKDFCYHSAQFTAGKDWAKVSLKFSDFAQANWGAQVPGVFSDVEKIQFTPGTPEAPFDFSIDDVTLVK